MEDTEQETKEPFENASSPSQNTGDGEDLLGSGEKYKISQEVLQPCSMHFKVEHHPKREV